MTTVAEILRTKADGQVHAVEPSDTVLTALRRMADKGIGALLVMEGDQIAGIFTERDYARKLALQGLSSAETMLVNVMTARLYVVSPRQTVQECLGIITKGRLRHLPVVDGGKLVGLVSIGDLVNAQLEEQRFIISQMENYIVGNMGDSQF